MIPQDQLAAYLDHALDDPSREAVELQLEQDAEALRFVLEQRQVDRVLGSLLAPTSRRQRLKASVLAAISAPSSEKLRAQVLADTSGRRLQPGAKALGSASWGERIRNWLDVVGRGLFSPGLARYAMAAVLLLMAVGGWFLFRPGAAAPIVVGRFAVVVGQPMLQHGAGGSTFNPQELSPIHLGARLETGDADKVELVFLDGTALRLGFNTAIELPNPKYELQSSTSLLARPPEIRLLRGQVWTKVQKTTNAPPYTIRTDLATAVARGTEFGVKLDRARSLDPSTLTIQSTTLTAILTVKEGAVDFFNAFGSVQATAMTESSAQAGSAPTEPKRLQTLQVVQVDERTTWSLTTSPLDWSGAAEKLAGGGGSVDWRARDVPLADGRQEVRISQLSQFSTAARAGLQLGDVVLALDGRPVTNAAAVQAAILLRPDAAAALRVRGPAGERLVALAVGRGTNQLLGPDLPPESLGRLTALLQQWIVTPAGQSPDAAMEKRRFEEAGSIAAARDVRAAAFNHLGVLWELEDALGPAIRAYARAVYLEPGLPLYHFNLALALRKIGSFERALEEFEHAARLQPGSVLAGKRLAEIQSLLGHHTEALALIETLLRGAPQDHGAWELKAQLLLKLMRPAEAVAPARLAVELEPDCPVAHAYLAEALHASKQLIEAGAAYAETLARSPFEAVYHMNHGTLQRDLGQLAAAEQSFRRAIELSPEFALAHRNLGEALADARRFAEAAAAFQKARELDPADSSAHWRFGDMALKRRQFDLAERAYRDALEVSPTDPDAFYGLGEVHRLQRRPTDAERSYRKAIELRPSYAAAHTALGIVFYDRGEVDEAERLYRRAIELDPESSAPRHNLGTLYREARRDPKTAETWFRQALELAPNDGESLGGLGLVASERGDLAEAERRLRRALERSPDSSALHNNLGEILRQRGRSDEAEPLYRKALELDPDNPAPYGNLGILQAERKQFAEAERMFRALVDRQQSVLPPARLPALVNLASVCAELGKLDEAEQLFRQALELAPDHPRVTASLASFLADHERKLDEALALAERAVSAQSDNPEFLDALGWVQAKRGDLDTAERTLQRALQLAGEKPPAAEIRAHLEKLKKRAPAEDSPRVDPNTRKAAAESGDVVLTQARATASVPDGSTVTPRTEGWRTVLDFQLTTGLPARGSNIGTDASGTVLYAVGGTSLEVGDALRAGVIHTSRDQGLNWVRPESKSAPDWQWEHARAFSATKDALLVGGNGRNPDWPVGTLTWFIRESHDGGSTWSTSDLLEGDRNSGCAEIAVHPNGDVYAGGSSATLGRIIRKRPTGSTKFATVHSTGPSDIGSCWAIDFAPDGSVLAAGDTVDSATRVMRWVVLRSASGDAGTWQMLDTFQMAEWTGRSARGCRVSRSGRLYVLGWAYNSKTSKNHWIVRASGDGGVNWSMSDDFNYGGPTVQVSEMTEDAAGNLFACGQAADRHGNLLWIVRRGSWITNTLKGKPVADLGWSTSDAFQLVPGKPALALGVTVDAAGNVFACGRAQDVAGIEHFIVRKLPKP